MSTQNMIFALIGFVAVIGIIEGFFARYLFIKSKNSLIRQFKRCMASLWAIPVSIIHAIVLMMLLLFWDLIFRAFIPFSDWRVLHSVLVLAFIFGGLLDICFGKKIQRD